MFSSFRSKYFVSAAKTFSIVFIAAFSLTVSTAMAERAAGAREKMAARNLSAVCPNIRQVAGDMFWKNNKPIRAGSALAAPVIGYNRVMTFAYKAGRRGPLGSSSVLYASDGSAITTMRAYPCRADHCGGRVVSSMLTATARRAAVSRTRSPAGYVKLSGSSCIRIPDIGACYNVKRRGPCLGIVK